MAKRLFHEGGPHKIRSIGNNEYHMSVTIPTDSEGRIARECPNKACSPAYFKVMPGTGVTEEQKSAFCPYCRQEAEATAFTTQEQLRYAEDIVVEEAKVGLERTIKDALGLGPSGRKKIGGGPFSIEMSLESGGRSHVPRPFEDEVRRDVACQYCTLDHTVFGLATWCPDCGKDIFLTHVLAEIKVIRRMLGDIMRREQDLGKRVAAKDLENCLEDAVSVFEASMKALVRRALVEKGSDREQVDSQLKQIANSFQNVHRSKDWLSKLFSYAPPDSELWDRLGSSFEKRHPVAHNLGVIDKKYLEHAHLAEREGREIRVSETEVSKLLEDIYSAISDVHGALFQAEKDDTMA